MSVRYPVISGQLNQRATWRGRVTVTGSAIRTRAKLSRKSVDFTVQGRSDLTAWVCTEKASEGAGVGVCTVSTLAGDNSRSRRARDSSDMLRLRRSPCPCSHYLLVWARLHFKFQGLCGDERTLRWCVIWLDENVLGCLAWSGFD